MRGEAELAGPLAGRRARPGVGVRCQVQEEQVSGVRWSTRGQSPGGRRAVACGYYAEMLLPAPTHLRECGKQEGRPANWPDARWTRGYVFSGTSATKGCRREALWSAAACRRFPSPEACFRQHLEQARDKKAAASCRTPKLTFCRCSPPKRSEGKQKRILQN